MAWPTDDLDTTALDEATDTPPRAEFLKHSQKLSGLIAGRATASGVCDLDASTKVPNARLYTGYGNGLTADNVAFQGFIARGTGETISSAATIIINSTNFSALSETADPRGWFNLSTGVFQPTKAGYYQINATVRASSLSVALTIYAYKNGVIYIYGTNGVDANGNAMSQLCFGEYFNGTTNYLDFRVDSGSDTSWYCAPVICAYKVGV